MTSKATISSKRSHYSSTNIEGDDSFLSSSSTVLSSLMALKKQKIMDVTNLCIREDDPHSFITQGTSISSKDRTIEE